jgi:PHD/YefM family antitoxin component YafN of YafNO toxin-antitoxin module
MLKHQKKLIESALVLFLSLNLSGCSALAIGGLSKLEVFSKPVEKVQLNLDLPRPVAANEVTWTVITPNNQEPIWEEIKKNQQRESFVCLSDEGYANLAITIAELRNNAAQARAIAKKYKEYYESTSK